MGVVDLAMDGCGSVGRGFVADVEVLRDEKNKVRDLGDDLAYISLPLQLSGF